jgi:hypothetical protein
MANPYDFTSGYFQSRSLAEQRQQAIERKQIADASLTESKRAAEAAEKFRLDIQGPYYQTEADKNRALANRYGVETDDLKRKFALQTRIQDDLILPELEGFGGAKGVAPKSGQIDFSTFGQGYRYGFKPEQAQSDYSMPTPNYGLRFDRKGYNDGTPGGLQASIQDTDSMDGSGGGAAPAAQPQSPTQMLAQADPKKADAITRNVFGMDNRKLAKLSSAFSLMDFASGKSSSKDFLDNQLNLQKMQSEGLGRATQQALLKNFDEAKRLFGEFGKDTGKDIDKFETILLSNPVPGNPKNVKDTYEAIRIKYTDGSNMVYDPRRLMADALSQKELQDMQEKIAASIRTAGVSVNNAEAVNRQTSDNALARKEARDADLKRNYQSQLSLDFNAEITRQLNMFTDKNNIDAKMPDGRRRLEEESARINGELSSIASTTAANIGVLDNNITFRQVQAALQNKDMAVGENGKPILKNANGQTFAMTTNGVFLPINPNNQQDNSVAPPPPAAPAPAPAPAPAASKVSNPRSVPTAQNPYASTRRAAIGGPFNEVDSNAIKNDLAEYQALLADNRPITKGRLKLLEQKLMAAGVIQ